ncbi:carboxypeptidase regulatory-like domain-containing protein [Silvibacterium acidisoli]|uniref:carboxypeptidase regulatory-like domain-containing protein n=1 Tax=Acidobacteriaceae bacterium ZG23-2 TaxID=2883246 RepID=UPI00406C1811
MSRLKSLLSMGALALSFAACTVSHSYAQSTNSGDIRGTVSDTSGALIPGAKVSVLNVDTGVAKDYITDQDGLFDTSSIIAGHYKLTFTKDGFGETIRGPITLQVGTTTVNASLTVGSTTQQVVVNTDDVPLLNTETSEQSTTMDSKAMSQLPNVGTDWESFSILLPGAQGNTQGTSLSNGWQGSNDPQQYVSANGSLPYSAILADGAVTTLPSSGNADVSIFETVSELQVITSNFSAQYGIGGIVFNQISKGGTNSFHGSAYEYFQNDALNAANYGFGSVIPVVPIRYNNFGGSIGGPLLKKKMFFFFDFDKTNNNTTYNGFITVPTQAMRNGDFTGLPTLYDPTTQTVVNGVLTRRSFQDEGYGNRIPANLQDPVAKALQAYYPLPNAGTPNQATPNANYYYSGLVKLPYTKYFGRLDYDVTSNNRLTITDTQRDNPTYNAGIGSAFCPMDCVDGDVDSNAAQISDVWNISPTTINEARMGFTSELNYYIPESLNQGIPAKLGWQFAKADLFPTLNFSGICCYNLNSGFQVFQKEFVYDPSDVVTMIRGKHIIHFGGEFLMWQANQVNGNKYTPGNFSFNGAYTQSTVGDSASGYDYADFMLGDSQSWSASVQPEFGARMKMPQMFVQDDIKLRPNLTVNLGVRYQIMHGWNEVKNNIAAFDPNVLNPATGTNGAIWYAATAANGRHALNADVLGTVLPRVGFNWSPNPSTTVRGGFGVYSYDWSTNTYGAGLGNASITQGSSADQTNGITPVVQLSGTGANLPYIGPTTDPAALNGQSATYTQFHTPVPKIYQWNFAVQRTLGNNYVAELAYVASHGLNLSFPVDINQVPEGQLSANDTPNGRPYPAFQSISGSTNNAISNYNSLQASITKRLTNGLSFNFNYVWSHFLDDQDSAAEGGIGGTQIYQSSYKPSANYGSSNFDARNALKGNIVYQLPVGKGKMFLNKSNWLDEAVGGWQVSSTMIFNSGNPYTVYVGGPNNSYSQAGNWYPNVVGNTRPEHRTIENWYNASAFAVPANGTFGDMHRNSLVGPGLSVVNLSAGKTFRIREGIDLQIRADSTNAFNHPSFGPPNQSLTPGPVVNGVTTIENTGTNISQVTVGGRTMQLNAHLSF